MANKIIIGILVVLALVNGGLGYYSYTLNRQVVSLGWQLAVSQMEQSASIDAVNRGLADLSRETQAGIGGLDKKLDSTNTEVDSLKGEMGSALGSALDRVDALEDGAIGTQAHLDTLQEQVGDAAAALSQSVINAGGVYQKISQVSVVIGNGDTAVGSGFIFDSAGHVVTASHVVDGLSDVYVTYADGRVAKAASFSASAASDVAVITLSNAPDIEAPPLGDSDRIQVGEPVIAIGNPFDLTGTLTSGIVSQTNRYARITGNSQSRWIANLIQFDAAVNFGNSGGLLANSSGEIIGMVIARVNPDEGDGIYYAVSANKLKRVAESLIAWGSYDYPWVGVNISNLTPNTVQSRGLDTTYGVLVVNVTSGGPAGTAGIKVDDILTAMDGVSVRNTADLISYLGEHKSPGDRVTITLLRGSTSMVISLEVGQLP